jgi:hypothetical protein
MNFSELVTRELFLNEGTGKNLLLLDIDDTLLTAQGIKIWRKLPTDKAPVALTPAEYAEETVTTDTKQYYDYREFRDADKVGNSIKSGIPIISNLKMMDEYIKNGWDIGILTARGMENVIFKSIKSFLKFKNAKGNLQNVGHKLVRDLVFAINDDNKKYKGKTDFAKKTNVMKGLLDKYDRVWLIDDDPKNIKAINDMKESLKNEKDNRHGKLRAIMAKKR